MDYIFHIWVIVILFRGVFAYYKLQKLPPEETAIEDITEEAVVKIFKLSLTGLFVLNGSVFLILQPIVQFLML